MTETTYASQPPRDPWTPQSPPPASFGAPPGSPAPRQKRPVALLAATAALAAVVGGGTGAVTVTLLDDPDPPATSTAGAGGANTGTPVTAPAGSTAAVAERVLPSVVQIRAGAGSGSGVVLDADGHIITNAHVVTSASRGGALAVVLHDGRRALAHVVGTDPGADLAVIKADGVTDLTPIAIGSSADLRVGEGVVAVGSPLGLSGTVTQGIVSSKNRPVSTGGSGGSEQAVLNAIQTDAPINPGNSGGALVNMRGELVGINSAIATLGGGPGGQAGSIGLGFAIPVDQAKRVADELIADGQATRARLGAEVGDVPEGGAVLGAIEAGSAAARAGLQPGDIVIRFDDQLIGSAEALVAAVRSAVPGSEVEVTYTRDGERRTAQVNLDRVPA